MPGEHYMDLWMPDRTLHLLMAGECVDGNEESGFHFTDKGRELVDKSLEELAEKVSKEDRRNE